MRRIITIITILLVVTGLVFGVLWFSARNKAVKNGTAKPTFREFITGETPLGNQPPSTGGTLSSSFTQDQPSDTSTGALSPTANTPTIDSQLTAPGTQTSSFTNDIYTPSNQNTLSPTQAPTTGGPVVYVPPTTTSSNGTSSTTTQGGGVSGTSTTAVQCSSADTTIVFTPQELEKLRTLERRFYTIVESIRTDEDVAREIGNHDTFTLKGTQIMELYNYCIQKTPQLSNPLYQKRVATPFWRTTNDTNGFITERSNQTIPISSFDNLTFGKRRLEYALKLNLW